MNNKYMVISKKHNGCVWYMTAHNQYHCEADNALIFNWYEDALAFKNSHPFNVKQDLILIALPHIAGKSE